MLNLLRHLLYKILFKGDDLMMAMMFAQRVILGKTKFEEVPGSRYFSRKWTWGFSDRR